MLTSRQQKLFYFVSFFATIVVISFVVILSKQHKYRSVSFEQKLIKSPILTKNKLVNVYTRRNLCAINVYDELPPITFKSNHLPTKSFLNDDSNIDCKTSLKIHDTGKLLYFVNEKIIWSSEKPRSYVKGVEYNLVKNYAEHKSIDDWTFSEETLDFTRLHLNPLAITKVDNFGKRIMLWSFMSGWDPVGVSREMSSSLPIALKKLDEGVYILISENRKKRVALCSNGDLLTIECGALKTKEDFSISLFKSLMQSYC